MHIDFLRRRISNGTINSATGYIERKVNSGYYIKHSVNGEVELEAENEVVAGNAFRVATLRLYHYQIPLKNWRLQI